MTVVSGNNVTVSFIEGEIVPLAPYPAPDTLACDAHIVGKVLWKFTRA